MQVNVNEKTISMFNLEEITGQTREQLLADAESAKAKGMVLAVDVPLKRAQNIFDEFESKSVEENEIVLGELVTPPEPVHPVVVRVIMDTRFGTNNE